MLLNPYFDFLAARISFACHMPRIVLRESEPARQKAGLYSSVRLSQRRR
jgi:hypothetical protein